MREVGAISSLLARLRAPWRRRKTRVHIGVWLLLVLGSFLQQPGRTTFDTKFDLTADPLRFLGRSLHLWNPDASFGEIQNQAYGYLFPQGPFFVLGKLLDLPDWVTQRLWCALLLIVAYEGTRRLARAWDIGPWWAQALAGLVYAFTPRLLSEVGTLTGEIVPTVVLPWVVLPLVLAQRQRLTPRSAALLSGVAILFIGGLNAVENLAALPLALLVAITSARPMRWRLTGWWVAAAAVASAWWLLPLGLLRTYSPAFLDYVESASVTTRPLSFSNILRGSDQWLQFFTISGRPWWPAGFALATEPMLILAAGIVAALGLAGVWRHSMPGRIPLVASLLLGLACLYAGHGGTVGSPISSPVRELLDGPLAAFRNVHKVDPLVRLPMALGFGHLLGILLPRLAATRIAALRRRPQLIHGIAGTSVVILLLVSAGPIFANQLRTPGWQKVPTAWGQVADFLARHDNGSRALVVPGSGFAQQTWGTTIDEPLQGYARTPWASRSQVPLAPGQTIRFLDALMSRIDSGAGSGALANELARSGIGFVVDRHDLDPSVSDAQASVRVTESLLRSPGLTRVASFGSTGLAGQSLIDIYRVNEPATRVAAVERSSVRTVAGAADDVFSVLESGLLGAKQPTVMAGESGSRKGKPHFVADGYRLRERQFGRTTDAVSAVMGVHDRFRQDRPVHDYPGTPGSLRAHLDASGMESMDASSSWGFADVLGPIHPERGPYAAVDGDRETAWVTDPFSHPTGEWLELHFRSPVPVSKVSLVAATDPGLVNRILSLRVTAGKITKTANVDESTGRSTVDFDGLAVHSLRITVTRVSGNPARGAVGIADVSVAGFTPHVSLALPRVDTDAGASWVLRADPGRRTCLTTLLGPDCDTNSYRPPGAQVGLSRHLTLTSPRTLFLSGQVVTRSTRQAAMLTEPIGSKVRIRATSVLGNDPLVSGQFAFDQNLGTSWLSNPGDPRPTLQWRWKAKRTIDRLQVVNSLSSAAAPSRAVIRSGSEHRAVDLTARGFGYFRPLRTNHLSIEFPVPAGTPSGASLGISELHVSNMQGLHYRPNPATVTGAQCGLGPKVYVDGHLRETYVLGSLDSVLNGTPLRLGLCGKPLVLSSGGHDISVMATDRFAPEQVLLSPKKTPSSIATARPLTVRSWGTQRRVLELGAGPAALLYVTENANPGWRATLGGHILAPTEVDGWQQAWLLPSGAGGRVTLTFTPDRAYRVVLVVGGLAALALLVGAVVSLVLDRRRATNCITSAESTTSTRTWCRPLRLAAAVTCVSVGGGTVAGGLLLGWLLRHTRMSASVVGPALVVLMSVVAALSATRGGASDPLAANIIGGIAVGVLCMAVLVRPASTKSTKEQSP